MILAKAVVAIILLLLVMDFWARSRVKESYIDLLGYEHITHEYLCLWCARWHENPSHRAHSAEELEEMHAKRGQA